MDRLNYVLLSKVRAVLLAADMPDCLWGEAFKFVVDVDNISPSSALGGWTPHELFYEQRLNVSDLRVWGCIAMVFVPAKTHTTKLSQRSTPALFLGYPEHTK